MKTFAEALVGAEILLSTDETAKTTYLRSTMAYWTILAVRIHQRFRHNSRSWGSDKGASFYQIADVQQDIILALMHALETHDPARGPLISHVWHIVWRDSLYQLAKATGWKFADNKPFRLQLYSIHGNEDRLPEPPPEHVVNRVANELARVAKSEEEKAITGVLRTHGVTDFRYDLVCEELPWWSQNLRVQRRSFQRVVQKCVERLTTE